MKNIKLTIANKIVALLPEAGLMASDIVPSLEYPPDGTLGDLAFPCFKLAKALRKAPPAIAASLADGFSDCPVVERAAAVGGYLNFHISPQYYTATLLPEILSLGADYGKNDVGRGKTVCLDYSSPNICKPFHVGHLGTTVIGHSLRKIHEFSGYKCVGINHLGDWGTQFGRQIYAFKKWGNRAEVEAGGVDELVRLYTRFYKEEEQDHTLADRAREEFRKLETGDPENVALWRWFIKVSMAEFERTYGQLDVAFDSYNGESFYSDKMNEQVELMREKGLLKLDNGASIVDLEKYGMPPCLILKSDGGTLYPTRDIAAAVYRARTYHFDKCIYVTASAQSLHFAQWFKVVELMGYDWYKGLVHVPYGMISVEGQKLSTRAGNVVLIRELISTAFEKAAEIIEEKNPNLPDKRHVALQIAVGAIVFHYLSNGRIKDINLIVEDALSFEGNTGPYAQYTYARTRSILEKAGELPPELGQGGSPFSLTTPEERELCKTLSRFPEAVENALNDYEPSTVTRYVLDLCAAFNRFYHECPIISAEDGRVRMTRIALTQAAGTTLRSALNLICVQTPERI